ncbi:glycosyltransferase family 1 protein [Phytohalomonas tamaricis]|uniref:glycosyltransferase family 1 protein n=1 Tax=Phytohalomonas tamaricis TaxID=2081032 RepID=UPI0021D42096|nr:glycosyltransferase family 1 protein [Phytohalomonas tamaricis]
MSRFARTHRVLFFEEPIESDQPFPWLEVSEEEDGVTVLVPRLPAHCTGEAVEQAQRTLLDEYLEGVPKESLVVWYYTPMSLSFADHLTPRLTVYDCMDELSAFEGAPPELLERERRLMQKADVIFTGGVSLFEAKRTLHNNVHPFPSSVDIDHFAKARDPLPEPEDQASIPYPRLGFYGVIDERLDLELLAEMARQRPDWHFVLVGPIVKIDPASLPQRSNIHYLGGKAYDELPDYLAGWDVALMPFALNESTRFISPTKTPEYLAGGRPVVSTPVTDVVRTYGHTDLVRIAATPAEFIAAIEAAFDDLQDRERVLSSADQILKDMSWDITWKLMEEQMKCAQ